MFNLAEHFTSHAISVRSCVKATKKVRVGKADNHKVHAEYCNRKSKIFRLNAVA